MRKTPLRHAGTVAASLRSDKRIALLSPYNDKTPKGEKHGYLQAILYLAPHTLAGGPTLCPHSTEACRSGCLFTAGRGAFDKVANARLRRTRQLLDDRDGFMSRLTLDLHHMQDVADEHEMQLAIRLNGTSDVLWERIRWAGGDASIFDVFPRATFFDYTRTPAVHRKVPPNWHLTFSLADDPISAAVEHLRAGRDVAAVVPQQDRADAPDWFALGDATIQVVDGELHDLRFLDEAPALVLLKPKGQLLRGSPMVRPDLIRDIVAAHRKAA